MSVSKPVRDFDFDLLVRMIVIFFLLEGGEYLIIWIAYSRSY